MIIPVNIFFIFLSDSNVTRLFTPVVLSNSLSLKSNKMQIGKMSVKRLIKKIK